ncbi:hypothetical protein RI129_005432 [Pyrocoelia pectoralis]|uniref:ABC transmembrane type-1 domain-containing protein n=1 Tax=Pyrocoelia pectoralis TaxID=417401 RepID=A0AAN7VKU1_9COLE
MNSARSIKRSKNPGENVNPFSAATFLYTIPTFIKGYKKPLEENDLYATLTEHQSEILANKVEILWNNELEKANQEKRKPSLTKVFLSAFGFEYMVFGLILATSEIVLKPAQAVFLGRLLLYYMPNVDNDAHTTQFEARLYAVGIALMSFLYILSLHPLMTHLQLTGLKAKIACCSLIYRKALKLNNGAFNKTNVGQIVNLISTDAPIFIMTAFLLNYIWIGPIQTVVVTYLMYREVGFSSIIGVLLLFAFIPIHHLLGKAASKYRLKAATRTDARVCYMNEIILGIKVIKMFGWEKLIKGLLFPLRNLEMKYVRQSMLVKVANLSFDVLIIPIVVYVTITMYVLHNDIRADKVFTLIIFYNSLRATMASSFPPAVGIRAVALVSVKTYRRLPSKY